jgi:tRNA-dihydrouridine synthase B
MLAPLEGYADNVLRTICFRHGADLTFSEMAHVSSFLRNNKSSLARINVKDSTPVQIQLLTGRERQLEQFLRGFKSFPGFMGFNLNLCCPSRKVIRQGKGAAMVKRATKTQKLVSIIKNYGYNVSAKLRLGLNQLEKTKKVYLNCLEAVEADFFIVHAKTAVQESGESEDYTIFPECVEAAGGRQIIANGGVDSAEKVRMLRDMGVGGIMIGRAAIGNPAIFNLLKNDLEFNEPMKTIPNISELKSEYVALNKRFKGQERYKKNFLRVVGNKIHDVIY